MKNFVLLMGIALCVFPLTAQTRQQVDLFSLNQVRLLESPFLSAQQTDLRYLLALEPDRLLSPFLREAGLQPKAPSYPNWENTGLDGHIGGHYLSALSMMYAATGDAEVKRRLDYFLDELKRCQDHVGTGFIGGTPGSLVLWEEIKRGDIRAGSFDLNGKWVPLYNIHKTYNGLLDAYIHVGSEQARDMLVKYTDWMLDITAGLSDEQMQEMLKSEHGGLNEVFAAVYEITGDKKYLQLAHRFSHLKILRPLIQEKDSLTGLHANTQIPKVIGYKRIADDEHNADWDKAARFFWKTVTENRSVCIGGNSVREHFNPPDDFSAMIEDVQGPETCNTYNMLRLTKRLYKSTPEVYLMDYYEKALFNHILSSEEPERGGFVYFTPMRPGHYRVYSQPETSFWCCVGTGLENHAKYGELIYAHDRDALYVNLFIPSRLTWEEKGVVFSQRTRFPYSGEMNFTFEEAESKKLALKLRIPSWVKEPEQIEVSVNGEWLGYGAVTGEYLTLERKWKRGDSVTLRLPMQVNLVQLPDKSPYYAFQYGPIVLAAPMGTEDLKGLYADDSRGGHIAHGKLIPLNEIPAFIGTSAEIESSLSRLDDEGLRFVYTGETFPARKDMEFIPFYALHNQRYLIYFPQTESVQDDASRQASTLYQNQYDEIENRTLDVIYPGEQQSESDHFIRYEDSETGDINNRHFRKARGWFGYRMKTEEPASYLAIVQHKNEANRSLILIDNEELKGEPKLEPMDDDFVRLTYALPPLKSGEHTIVFQPAGGEVTSSVFEIRLLK
ncbi:glycoside hydrolase family 127 protein [Anaerorudis cellulosivorans]|uniref:glycoside hydrolase family 127 protein n=1 Tax=Anaerorudis cellulosivorans TaxID=3397862 RepID=UPI00221E9D9E|nr:glycoside hydrolase family 127 protein [Seramator thermalis]MCW1734221.1 glycoside hydrolase family 127 protein [Seramator thermalis]